ncbi:hypothetical protein [Asticcacaulis machinosus]|uniref:Glycerophosphoryl diester phosphodiesterase membrane domain-containing protein n=1 Tax=Asticcacaulis machinosus TaxID=2984211 RepID=A0ABT5HM69_9CAUL|nr:hypothetical protein [Asticcacaulis machinosus]MDC7677343.1 hypothetical protein [Asticcacaulis machinosus]
MKLSIDFAFAGFEIIKKNPVAVLLWGVVYTVVSLVATVLMVLMGGTSLAALQSYEQSPPADPTAVFGQLAAILPSALLAGLIGLVVSAVIQCAVYRTVLQPSAKGFGYMQLGSHELRQVIATILWYLAFFLFYILFLVAAMIPLVLASLVTRANGVLGGILIFIVAVAAVVAFIYILSRWSLALVQSFDERKINLLGSFKLTKGSGWTLLGGYVLLTIVVIMIAAVVFGVLFGVAMGMGIGFSEAASQIMQPDMSSLTALFTGIYGIQIVISGLLSGIGYALFYGATTAAYQALSTKGTNAADAF